MKEVRLSIWEDYEHRNSEINHAFFELFFDFKQHSRGDHRKICSEDTQHFFRRTPMPKLLSNFIEIELRLGVLL